MKEQATIEQMNEAICVFCGYKVVQDGLVKWLLNESLLGFPVQDLRYHESWTWLMPVIEKIEGLGYKFQICRRRVRICEDSGTELHVLTVKEESKLNSVYAAVVQFIQWYNSNKS